jgi:hypothetical protein
MAFNPFCHTQWGRADLRAAIERLERQGQKNADALTQQPHCVGES